MQYPKDGLSARVGQPVSIRCPACGHVGMFTPYKEVTDLGWVMSRALANGAYLKEDWRAGVRLCPNRECGGLAFAVTNDGKLVEAFPPQLLDFDSTNLPQPILATLEEAVSCHGAGAYMAAALMVRRLLEELCEDRGAQGGNLRDRLKNLGQGVVVPAELLDAADELRVLGNDAAHIEAKAYSQIGREEATLALELAKELLKAVYQYSALVGRLRSLKKRP